MNAHLTENKAEFERFIDYWLEEKPARKEIYREFLKSGQVGVTQGFAETYFLKEFNLKYDTIEVDGNILVRLREPIGKSICFPITPELNIHSSVGGLLFEQHESSPHKYKKVPENCVVLDFGCSEGIFPALCCNSTNSVVGFDMDGNYEKAYLMALKENGIANGKFFCNTIGSDWELDGAVASLSIGAIKMDIEGYELDCLMKLEDIIIKNKPMLQIACYHYDSQFIEILDYCINVLGYSNFDFNKNHMLFSLEKKYCISDNFLKQGLIIANY